MAARRSWLLVLALCLFSATSGLPAPGTEEKAGDAVSDDAATLATELLPPAVETVEEKNVTLFIINLYAVQNFSGEGSEEVLDNELVEKVPGIIGPLATIFLLVEEDNDEEPVDLDEMSKYLQDRGYQIEKINGDGETSVLRINLKNDEEVEDVGKALDENSTSDESNKKVRRRRMACHKCHGHGGGGHGGGGGGYGGGGQGGGGGGTIGVIPVYVIPQVQQPVYQPQPVYRPQPVYHPPPQQPVCDPCAGRGGGGGGGGGGGAWATATASASAGSWGK